MLVCLTWIISPARTEHMLLFLPSGHFHEVSPKSFIHLTCINIQILEDYGAAAYAIKN